MSTQKVTTVKSRVLTLSEYRLVCAKTWTRSVAPQQCSFPPTSWLLRLLSYPEASLFIANVDPLLLRCTATVLLSRNCSINPYLLSFIARLRKNYGLPGNYQFSREIINHIRPQPYGSPKYSCKLQLFGYSASVQLRRACHVFPQYFSYAARVHQSVVIPQMFRFRVNAQVPCTCSVSSKVNS